MATRRSQRRGVQRRWLTTPSRNRTCETHDKEPFTPFGKVLAGLELIDSVNAEYGEGPGGIRAGKQDPYFEGGNAWLLREFPRLDYIKRATILSQK